MDDLMPPGSLRRHPELLVTCARCTRRDYTDQIYRDDAKRLLRSNGWREVRGEGWVCPDCLDLLAAKEQP